MRLGTISMQCASSSSLNLFQIEQILYLPAQKNFFGPMIAFSFESDHYPQVSDSANGKTECIFLTKFENDNPKIDIIGNKIIKKAIPVRAVSNIGSQNENQ